MLLTRRMTLVGAQPVRVEALLEPVAHGEASWMRSATPCLKG